MVLDREALMQRIPHRPPMLLIDRVIFLDEGIRGIGVKAVSADEPFLQGHFPGDPIFPGCMILEAMAQMAALVANPEQQRPRYLVKVDRLRFLRPVRPGDELEIEAIIEMAWGGMAKAQTTARVRHEIVASAEITAG